MLVDLEFILVLSSVFVIKAMELEKIYVGKVYSTYRNTIYKYICISF